MKIFVLVLIAIGCGSSEPAGGRGSAAGAGRPAVTDPLGFCERARLVMTGRRACFPEDTSLKMGLAELAELVRDAPTAPPQRRRVGVTCAVMLDGMMRAEQPLLCPLDVTDAERAELAAFLGAWYGARTAPPKTGDPATDAALVDLARRRDAACACKDLACARLAGRDLDDGLASTAPAVARDAAAQMVDEVGRCRQQLANRPPD
ncbi:MAG: hypothetical protein NT062_23600 [Proteobacteria bacterium]|nr:hypothetical protein [Pseudomonadota bacterium]